MHVHFHQNIQAGIQSSFTGDCAASTAHINNLIQTHGPVQVYDYNSSGWVDWSDELIKDGDTQDIILLKWRYVNTRWCYDSPFLSDHGLHDLHYKYKPFHTQVQRYMQRKNGMIGESSHPIMHCLLFPVAQQFVCRQLKSLYRRLPEDMLLPDLHEAEREYVQRKFQRQGSPLQVIRAYKTVWRCFLFEAITLAQALKSMCTWILPSVLHPQWDVRQWQSDVSCAVWFWELLLLSIELDAALLWENTSKWHSNRLSHLSLIERVQKMFYFFSVLKSKSRSQRVANTHEQDLLELHSRLWHCAPVIVSTSSKRFIVHRSPVIPAGKYGEC